MTDKFDQWCIVELFGHNQIAGRVTEQSIGGLSFVRVDVPQTTKRDPFTKFYGGGAIYAITPAEQSVVQAMAEGLDTVPIETWRLKIVDVSRQIAASHPDRDDWDASMDWRDDAGAVPVPGTQPGQSSAVAAIPDPTISERAAGDVLSEVVADDADPAGRTEGWRTEEASTKARAAAAGWARILLAEGDFVIFDTETTGFDEHDEIIQIGIIDHTGAVVLDQLIRPTQPILNTQYHGITDAMVQDAPGFPDAYEAIQAAFEGKTVLAYNWDYDSRMLAQVCRRHDLEPLSWTDGTDCVMERFADFYGEWDDYHGNYRWKKLREALAHFGLKHADFGAKEHDAGTDAKATLAVIRKMAEWTAEAEA
jgi:DNA polymerase-3 subunit epsilon